MSKNHELISEVLQQIKDEYSSEIINELKASGYSQSIGRITIHLAPAFGFCYGVNRAIKLAYETSNKFPDKNIYLTTEIIHNPSVNKKLSKMGIRFLSGQYKNADISEVTKDDIVLVPAFGATVNDLTKLEATGCQLVNTICGSVVNVWKRVENYAQDGFTSVIHGKYYHEETLATSSQVLRYPKGQYLIILNHQEAEYICNYIINGGCRDAFFNKFKNAHSPGFDPDIHLEKIGLANQTTMLSSESFKIGELFRKALIQKYGKNEGKENFYAFETICSATQERQDAILSLKAKKTDLIIVIGGYNSSNTGHLHKIAMTLAPSYHIDQADCIVDESQIRHKPLGKSEEIIEKNWLPDGIIAIGVTAGASTPDKVMGKVVKRLKAFADK